MHSYGQFLSLPVAFSNISKHALNTVFAVFEIFLTNIGPLPWVQLPVTVLLLVGYLGVAYITHATQGFYSALLPHLSRSSCSQVFSLAYSFLDPKKQGKLLAAYIVGIAVGQIIVFLVVHGIIVLRERLTRRKQLATDDGLGQTDSDVMHQSA